MLGLRFVQGLSLVAASGGHPFIVVRGPLFIAVRGPLTIAAPPVVGAQAPDAQAQQLWLTGPVAPRHVGSSQTRARTRVPCISRQILNHCATREAPSTVLNSENLAGGGGNKFPPTLEGINYDVFMMKKNSVQ